MIADEQLSCTRRHTGPPPRLTVNELAATWLAVGLLVPGRHRTSEVPRDLAVSLPDRHRYQAAAVGEPGFIDCGANANVCGLLHAHGGW